MELTVLFELPRAPEVELAPLPRRISVGAFFDRFGDQKLPILASADSGVKALILDCSVRQYIDLDNPALPYGIDMLIAAGFVINKSAILTAKIAGAEMLS